MRIRVLQGNRRVIAQMQARTVAHGLRAALLAGSSESCRAGRFGHGGQVMRGGRTRELLNVVSILAVDGICAPANSSFPPKS